MAYEGVVIALDLASLSGIAEGCPGERPQLSVERFRKEHDEWEESFGRAIRWIAERLQAPRYVAGRFYDRGEAIENGLIRVAIEKPIEVFTGGGTNADALLATKGLWACIGGFAHTRGAMVRRFPVQTIRKHFLGYGNIDSRVARHLPNQHAKKDAKRVCQALGWSPPNLDAADAGALWWFACREWAHEVIPDVRPHWVEPASLIRERAA